MLKRYSICFTVGTGIVCLVFALNGFSLTVEALSDAFSVAGLAMTLFALLLFVSGEGAFLGLGYALKNAVRLFLPAFRRNVETYTQYRARKTEQPKSQAQTPLFCMGIVFLSIGILFLTIWINL